MTVNLSPLAPSLTLWTQALLQEAHEVEVKKQKAEDKIEKQLAVNKEDTATEVQIWSIQLSVIFWSFLNAGET